LKSKAEIIFQILDEDRSGFVDIKYFADYYVMSNLKNITANNIVIDQGDLHKLNLEKFKKKLLQCHFNDKIDETKIISMGGMKSLDLRNFNPFK